MGLRSGAVADGAGELGHEVCPAEDSLTLTQQDVVGGWLRSQASLERSAL